MGKLSDETGQQHLSLEEGAELVHVLNHHVHPSSHLSNTFQQFLHEEEERKTRKPIRISFDSLWNGKLMPVTLSAFPHPTQAMGILCGRPTSCHRAPNSTAATNTSFKA